MAAAENKIGPGQQGDRTAQAGLIILQRKGAELVGRIAPVARRIHIVAGVGLAAEGEFIGAALEDDVDHAAHGLAVFGIESAADDLHFLQQGAVDAQGRRVVIAVVDADAVDLVLHLAGAAAAEMAVDYTGLEIDDLLQILDGHDGDGVTGHCGHRAGQIGLDDRTLGHDLNALALDHTLFELDVLRGGVVGSDENLADGHGFVADEGVADLIASGGNVEDGVIAIQIAHCAQLRAVDDDVGARKGLFGLVGDASGQLAGRAAQSGRRRDPEEHHRPQGALDGTGRVGAGRPDHKSAHSLPFVMVKKLILQILKREGVRSA